MLADWPLDGATADVSGHGLGGTFTPGTPNWIPGHDGGSAIAFDGSSYISATDSAVVEPAHVAVDAWVRRTGSPGDWRYVLSKGAVGCNRSAYGLYSGWAGGIAFYVSDSSYYVLSPEAPASIIWNGAWHHVTGSYDGTRVRVSVDGAEVGSGTATTLKIDYGSGSKGVRIGAYSGGCDLGFAGDIDEVRILSDAPPLSATPLPAITPAPGTPTIVPVGGSGSGAGGTAQQPGSSQLPSASKAACMRVTLNPRSVKVKRRVRVRATVRRAAKPVSGVRVMISGAGVNAKARTNRKGTATITVKARKRGKLSVRVVGQKASCPRSTVRAQ